MSTPIEWIVAYLGIAGMAMWLMSRSHDRAFKKLGDVYDKEMEHQQMLIEVLNMAIEALRREDDRHDT